MGLISGLLGLAGAGIDAGAGLATAKAQYGYQRQLNQQQDDFNERMSNTQYQRGSQDMLKAGLNPALMFKSGGPDVAMAASGGNAPNVGANVGHVGSTAMHGFIQANQAKQIEAQTKTAQAQADKTQAETGLLKANSANLVAKTMAETANLHSARGLMQQKYEIGVPENQRANVLARWQGVSNARAVNQLLSEGLDTVGKSPLGVFFGSKFRQAGKISAARSALRS